MFRWIIILALYATFVQGRSVRDMDEVRSLLSAFPSSPGLWQPSDGQSREDWLQCHGQPADVCRRTREKLSTLKKLISGDTQNEIQQPKPTGVPAGRSMERRQETASPEDDTLDGCIWLTEEQIDDMIHNLKNDTTNSDAHSRQKRTLLDFTRSPYSKWTMPITYKFDGSHSVYQMATIRDAFNHWADNTCVRFKEVPTDQEVSTNHVLITGANTGCHSFVGRIRYIPQQLNLQSGCIRQFGIPVHEIGHTLGMWHEQMRSDRDDSIRIEWDNIYSRYRSQYQKITTHNLVQYNFGSVMQYAPRGGSSSNGKETMRALNPLYQRNMGQRTGLSFENIKMINLAYCADRCVSTSLERPCQHGGYQDPNNCTRCICPDGFAGRFCDELAQPTYADCGGVINLASGNSHTIKSPGYDNQRYYLSYQGCSWWIKAPIDHAISLRFVGDFGIYCSWSSCFHWVEVKYKADLGLEGPRFCCMNRPTETVTSESREMMIIFKSNYSYDYLSSQRGFQAVVTAVRTGSPEENEIPSSSPSTTTSTTTRTTTTTRATTRATTTPTTTTTTSSSQDCKSRDLTLALDSSRSVDSSHWSKLMSFVRRLVVELRRRNVVSRIAVITYSHRASVALPLADHDVNDLAALSRTPGWGRNVSGALRLTRTSFMNPKSLSTCLLVTSGTATVDRHLTLTEADAARRSRLGVVVLGVGSHVNGSEAAAIATHKNSGVVYADSFDHLLNTKVDFAKLLSDKICESDKPPAGGNGQSTTLWSCSFEESSNALCGMTQEQSHDQFDWIIHSGSTPSNPTGPDMAYHGRFYAYIETSNPRRPNDEAWLLLPMVDYTGLACVDFYYHMYGFHIRILRLVQRTTTSNGDVTRTVWMRSRDMGNAWYHGTSQVHMSPDSQLIFVGIRGDEYSGDIAIDNVKINTGACR